MPRLPAAPHTGRHFLRVIILRDTTNIIMIFIKMPHANITATSIINIFAIHRARGFRPAPRLSYSSWPLTRAAAGFPRRRGTRTGFMGPFSGGCYYASAYVARYFFFTGLISHDASLQRRQASLSTSCRRAGAVPHFYLLAAYHYFHAFSTCFDFAARFSISYRRYGPRNSLFTRHFSRRATYCCLGSISPGILILLMLLLRCFFRHYFLLNIPGHFILSITRLMPNSGLFQATQYHSFQLLSIGQAHITPCG